MYASYNYLTSGFCLCISHKSGGMTDVFPCKGLSLLHMAHLIHYLLYDISVIPPFFFDLEIALTLCFNPIHLTATPLSRCLKASQNANSTIKYK